MKRWKIFLAVLISLWLPLQGYGAVAMPFCKHGTGTAAAESGHGGDHSMAQHHGDSSHDHHPVDHSAGSAAVADDASTLACSNCGACQLACSPILFSPPPVFSALDNTIFDPQPVQQLFSFSPEQPQRPPLSALG